MTDRSIMEGLVRQAPILGAGDRVDTAMRAVLGSGLPALPVVDDHGKLVGMFGEQEFVGALFPGYFKDLPGAAFVRRSLDDALETRAACRAEPVAKHMNKERVHVPHDFSSAHIAETFLHHSLLVVPVVDDERRPTGVITRGDFTRRLAERLLERPED